MYGTGMDFLTLLTLDLGLESKKFIKLKLLLISLLEKLMIKYFT